MKMLNKNGFILVETLIVTLFVLTIFILVYQNLVPSIGTYQSMTNYDDVDSVYAANTFKQGLLKYGNLDYINEYLASNTYLDITDCSNTDIYKNTTYCEKLKKNLSITDDDYIFITNYDISSFRTTVKEKEFFDISKLSGFRDYISTVSNTESFYNKDTSEIVGKYRIFMTRTVTNSDQTTTVKYVNLGVYTGSYKRYNMGEVVTFSPGTNQGTSQFYVLKNSSSYESTVTLILDHNIGTNTSFNSTGNIKEPDTVLSILKENTKNWDKVNLLTANDTYKDGNGYTISYNGYRARLLEPNDIYTIFGTTIDHTWFNNNTFFSVDFTMEAINFLSNGLSNSNGYWMANMVAGNTEMAWTIQDKKIKPVLINTENIGVRPIVVVSKDILEK